MKNKRIFKTFSALCLAAVMAVGFTVPAFAQGTDQSPAEDATNDANVVVEETEDSPALTPEGNAALVDDFGGNKQLMENNLTYTRNGDYLIPDLKLTEQPPKPLGKYGRLRKAYLKEHRPLIYNQLLMTEKLYPHLWEIDETANRRLEQMMPQLAESAGATEELKARDPMRWVGLMNTCKAQAEEILMAELINS